MALSKSQRTTAMKARSEKQKANDKKANENAANYTSEINRRRKEIAEGKGGAEYLTQRQIDSGLTEVPYRQQRHQEAMIQGKEYDEITDQIVPKGTMAKRIKRYPGKYEKYTSSANKERTQADFWNGVNERSQNIEQYTPQQRELQDFIGRQFKGRLPETLDRLSQPAATPMSSQLEKMFGHMQNPILQGILNPYLGQNVQPLFPSQLAQQSNGGIESLLGQLGNSALQYGVQNAPTTQQLGDYGRQYGQQLGEYGQQFGGNIMDLLSGLASRFRGNSQSRQPQG